MPIHLTRDTLDALGGPGLHRCDSRSLFKDKFVFFDDGFDEDKRVALDLFISNGRRDLESLKSQWNAAQEKQERNRREGRRVNENELRKATSAIRATSAFLDTTPSSVSSNRSWLSNLPHSLIFRAKTASRLLVGLANGALENSGCTLHSRFGFPVIPGSALKGIARDAAVILGKSNDVIRSIFGGLPGDDQSRQGDVAFLDAHATLQQGQLDLELDVVTPHFQKYYGGSGNPNALDDESPIPSVFPAVAEGIEFEFALIVHTARIAKSDAAAVLKEARECLEHAIIHLGVGAKTASGYGRFLVGKTKAFATKQDLFPPPPKPVLSPKEEFLKKWEGNTANTFRLKALVADLSKIDSPESLAKLFDAVMPPQHLKNFRSANPYWAAFLREGGKAVLAKLNRELPRQ